MSAVILAWSAQWESLPQQADKKLVWDGLACRDAFKTIYAQCLSDPWKKGHYLIVQEKHTAAWLESFTVANTVWAICLTD